MYLSLLTLLDFSTIKSYKPTGVNKQYHSLGVYGHRIVLSVKKK